MFNCHKSPMLFSFLSILFFVLPLAYAGDALDKNCTDGAATAPKYLATAFACDNAQADSACALAYDIGSTTYKLEEGNDQDRPANCYTSASPGVLPIMDPLKDMAIATCAKQCGYCCETPAYKCENARFPRINCNTVTSRMCKDPLWRETIAQDCPNKCGFCLLGGCIDAAPDCATQPSICVTRGMEAFVASNCKRTCDQCNSTGGGTAPCNTALLTDANSNCASWVKNGFCNNSFYTDAQKKSYCARSCGLC